MTALEVKGTFNAAWWPSILKSLKDAECPKNLYYLSQGYFSQRTAALTINNISIERRVTKGYPQGSCCGPGLWNLLYNSMFDLQFTSHTKVIAFADDLIILTKGESIRVVGPCHHGMARRQVSDRGTASFMEGSCE